MIQALKEPLEEIAGYDDLKKQISKNRGVIEVSGCLDSQKAHLAAGLGENAAASLVIVENELKARELYEDMRLFVPDVLYFPRRDLIFYQADLAGNLLTKQRICVIKALIEQKKVTVVTSTGGCMDFLLPIRVFKNKRITIREGEEMDLVSLAKNLAQIGYERVGLVQTSGQFSVRGDIVDIYSLTEEQPWRIEFFGDTVDQIKCFDPESQRSSDERAEEIHVYPASEEIEEDIGKKRTDTFSDYFPEKSLLILDEPARILENAKVVSAEYEEAMKHRLEEGKIAPEDAKRMITAEMLAADFDRRNCVALSLMEQHHLPLSLTGRYQVSVQSVNSYNGQFSVLVQDLKKWKKGGYRVVLLSASRTRGMRLAGDLQKEELNAIYSEDPERVPAPGEILVLQGTIRRGFSYPLQKFVLITETDIFGGGKKKSRRKKKSSSGGEAIRDFSELSVGDYVVHEDHGLGIYRGLEKVEVDHVTRDFIKIEYAGGSSLYVPATQLNLLQKYSGSGEGRRPRINSLGGKEWGATKSRVKSAVQNIAKELVDLYAARSGENGYQYQKDTPWQTEFEEMFPFEETDDQIQAIEDVKKDMESPKIMDRLICGDVGYGKTEIAVRAAFKAVQENKQVVLLCPTTILAQQHFRTFSQRMKDYPVTIDMMSRFRTAAEQKKTLEKVRKGQVDILIGTHRVLSKDVRFKDLGLLIVDEEQRFGVKAKERIKEMRKNVDVLTLTATPIPRTLHMSLIGIRDMSILEEPPMDRMPVQTYVMEYDEELVREAISRELARHGQVFFVYNRVRGIAEMAARIQELVPEATVAYAHGKMKEGELEQIMYNFVNGDIDVLVSTTIIETGMDISNANTLIVCDADRLGLAQLYQLRGRVGRSNRTAYAFLMYKRDKMLKEDAEKRLHAIREFTELGSGVKIAMRDLEIRGAGNLLGAEQSGHMEEVGYDLYCKMLNEAVQEAKGDRKETEFETSIDLVVDAFIPASYIQEESQKLDIYKRISGIENREEADDMIDELIDRYGDPPKSVLNLIRVSMLREMAHAVYVTEIRQDGNEIRISLYPKARMNAAAIPVFLQKETYRNRLFFHAGQGTPFFTYQLKTAADKKSSSILTYMEDLMKDLQELLLPDDGAD